GAREPGQRPRLREAVRSFRVVPLLRWAFITAALAETLALPLVTMMPAVTESLNRDAADRLGVLVACIAVGSLGQVFILAKLSDLHQVRHRGRPKLNPPPSGRRARRDGARPSGDLEAEPFAHNDPHALCDLVNSSVAVDQLPAALGGEPGICVAHSGVEIGAG